MNNHLTLQQMLAYVDGELSKSESRRAEDHLHSCWTCLTEIERLKSDIATILDAQNESFSPALPPPSRPWLSFETLLARSVEAQPISLRTRLTAYVNTFLSPVRILVASVIVVVLSVGAYSMFRAKPVSAKEVLRRVQIADTERSVITKDQVIRERVHIRKSTHNQSPTQAANIDTWKSPTATYWNVPAEDSVAADLKAQYLAHNIPAGLPLSAASVDAWGSVVGGTPTVARQGSVMDLSFDRSAGGAAGSVERVRLLVQPETWQVKQMTLDFPDASFEVTEDDYSVMPTSAVPSELLAYLEPEPSPMLLPQSLAHPVSGIAARSTHLPMANLDKAELGVFAALHNLKADLGEPITVIRSNQAVQVGIWELPPDRQNELQAALANEPGVQVELLAPRLPLKNHVVTGAATPQPAPSDAPLNVELEAGDEDQRLLKFFGTSEREQDFTNNAVATSTAILSHLYALRNLQVEFPAEREQSLAQEERTQLHTLVEDHVTAISTNVDALGRQLAPLDRNFSVTPCASAPLLMTTTWQGGSLEALETGKVIDHVLRALLTTSRAPAVPVSALPEIDQNLCRLRAELKTLSAPPQ
jgi:hypothetical protein